MTDTLATAISIGRDYMYGMPAGNACADNAARIADMRVTGLCGLPELTDAERVTLAAELRAIGAAMAAAAGRD